MNTRKNGDGRRFLPIFRSLCVCLSIGACSSNVPKKETAAFDARLASSVSTSAAQAAVGSGGTKVCRWIQIGIAERDLLRGVVQQQEGDTVRVRIEEPGRFPNTLNGVSLARGALVADKAIAWTPCAP